jgi:hypothetical protein
MNIKDATEIQDIPNHIIQFLMDSPLWPMELIAYWTQIPNCQQAEDECAARMPINVWLVAIVDNPFECLIPFNFVGKEKHDAFTNYSHVKLNIKQVMLHMGLFCGEEQRIYSQSLVSSDYPSNKIIFRLKSEYPNWRDFFAIRFSLLLAK